MVARDDSTLFLLRHVQNKMHSAVGIAVSKFSTFFSFDTFSHLSFPVSFQLCLIIFVSEEMLNALVVLYLARCSVTLPRSCPSAMRTNTDVSSLFSGFIKLPLAA